MNNNEQHNQEERILVLAPTGRDAAMTARFLNDAGLRSEVCDAVDVLCRKMAENAGLLFLTGEALTPETMSPLMKALRHQPKWSDVPLIVLTSGGGENPSNAETIEELSTAGNVTLIERPVRLMTLISAVKSGLRARRKQYDARDFLVAEMESKEALRQSEERLRIALDAARLGTWQINLRTKQLEGSEICKESFGLQPEMDFLFQDLIPTIHPADRRRAMQEIAHAVRNREEYKSEFRVVWSDDSVHWILSRGTVNYDDNGKPFNVVGVTLDITEPKIAEKQREEMLEREQAARAEAETANRLKDEFLATVSHELRTPLNAMLGWTTLLRSGRLGVDDTQRALETVERNARTQAEIIEDLLDVSRIITGKLNLQITPIEPAAMVKTAVESLQLAADAKEIEVRQVVQNKLNTIMGDSARIQQIIWNLLSNAIKFTPNGGKVEIRLKREATHLAIAVSDTGNGIDSKFLPYVFDRFLQADGTTTRTYGGLGLGLAIVRHLVELHGGTVKAESDGAGKGATFTVRLPLVHKSKQKSKTNGRLPGVTEEKLKTAACDDLTGLKILVVDDEADSLELIKISLEHCGAHVSTAGSAAEALKLLDAAMPDVLISDIGMPETDGFDLIKKVREFEPARGGEIPAVALTAYARQEDKQRALHSGFQTHLSKPVEMEELINTVAEVVKRG